MPYETGPALLIDTTTFQLVPDPPEFEAFAQAVADAVQAAEDETAGHTATLDASAKEWQGSVADSDASLAAAANGLAEQTGSPLTVPASIDPQVAAADSDLAATVAAVPPEGWAETPVPAPVQEILAASPPDPSTIPDV